MRVFGPRLLGVYGGCGGRCAAGERPRVRAKRARARAGAGRRRRRRGSRAAEARRSSPSSRGRRRRGSSYSKTRGKPPWRRREATGSCERRRVKTKKVSKDERGLFRNGLLRARRVNRTFPSRRGRRRPRLRRASDERENAVSRHAGNTPHAKPYESKSLRLPLRTLARFHHHARVLLVRAFRVVGRSLRVISASVHEGVALHDASGEGSRVEQLMVGRTGRTGVMYVLN